MGRGRFRLVWGLFVLLVVAGCGGSGGSSGDSEPQQTAATRYALANSCLALKSRALGDYTTRNKNGYYVAAADSLSEAEGFFMKPTALGKYMFYTPDESLLVVTGGEAFGYGLGRMEAPANEPGWGVDESAEWTMHRDDRGNFTVVSETAGKALAVNEGGALVLADEAQGDAAQQFRFIPAEGCTEFPEYPLQVTGETFKGTGVDEPALGFADVHNHISATDFLGKAHVGEPFHRFGITEALGSGSERHGNNGLADLVGNLYVGTPLQTHDTQGWPTFQDWPGRTMLTHEGTYYRWIQRSYMAGLRVLNNYVVENQALCTVHSLLRLVNVGYLGLDDIQQALGGLIGQACSEMENAVAQIHYMRRMQDYIDAQAGGPGEGWFRIVESPAEAREVINDGKLAVILGIEISHLFNCDVTKVASSLPDINGCDRAEIDAQLDRLYELGIRQLTVMHEFNNALGGNGIFNDFVLNFGNFVDTGGWWKTHDCPDVDYLYPLGKDLVSVLPVGDLDPDNPLSFLILDVVQGLLPVYPDGPQCNDRALTDLGEYAVNAIMDKGILIDVDHMSYEMKSDVIEMARQRQPDYPLISTHGGQGGISTEQGEAIFDLGGFIFPQPHDAIATVDDLRNIRALRSDKYEFALGFGADTNGLARQTKPRGEEATAPVNYPFTLFSGPEWGPEFDRVAAVTFEQSSVPASGRVFDLNEEGMAHYGLVPDWVESLRIEGGQESLEALYKSAEVFLRTWERTVER